MSIVPKAITAASSVAPTGIAIIKAPAVMYGNQPQQQYHPFYINPPQTLLDE